jgi:hypothetical protein
LGRIRARAYGWPVRQLLGLADRHESLEVAESLLADGAAWRPIGSTGQAPTTSGTT